MMQRPNEKGQVEPADGDTIEVVQPTPLGQPPAFGAQARSERVAPPPRIDSDLGEVVDGGDTPGFRAAAKPQKFA